MIEECKNLIIWAEWSHFVGFRIFFGDLFIILSAINESALCYCHQHMHIHIINQKLMSIYLDLIIYLFHVLCRLILTSALVTQKFYSDIFYSNNFFTNRCGFIEVQELNRLEEIFLDVIDWNLTVDFEEYETYDNGLRQFFEAPL